MLASVLENLVDIYREERQWRDVDVLLMEHYCKQLDSNNDKLSSPEWIVLCDDFYRGMAFLSFIRSTKRISHHLGR
jgi:hypothetical protein